MFLRTLVLEPALPFAVLVTARPPAFLYLSRLSNYRNWTLCPKQETRNILCELNSEPKLRGQA